MSRLHLWAALFVAALLLAHHGALAQSPNRANIVASCGTPNNTYTTGDTQPMTMDTTGKLCNSSSGGGGSSAVTISPSSSAAVGIVPVVAGSGVSSSVLKATPGNLYGVYATTTAAAWLMVFNSTTAPSNGATTAGIASGNMQDCIPIAAGGYGSINYIPGPPEVFSVGITAVISSTACATLTLATTGFIHGSVQ